MVLAPILRGMSIKSGGEMQGCRVVVSDLALLQQSVDATTVRGLDLLRAIEQTIDALDWIADHARADAAFAAKESARINACERTSAIDQGDVLCDKLEKAQALVEKLHTVLQTKRESAQRAAELRDDDGVVDAYTDAIAQVADLHDAINGLRWAIMEHDADLSPAAGKRYTSGNIEELFSELDS